MHHVCQLTLQCRPTAAADSGRARLHGFNLMVDLVLVGTTAQQFALVTSSSASVPGSNSVRDSILEGQPPGSYDKSKPMFHCT